jgi:hypothetical protein
VFVRIPGLRSLDLGRLSALRNRLSARRFDAPTLTGSDLLPNTIGTISASQAKPRVCSGVNERPSSRVARPIPVCNVSNDTVTAMCGRSPPSLGAVAQRRRRGR